MGAVNKCRSAVLTNRLSSGMRCHKGIAEALQRSLCVASHSHPSSQLIRLIFTSITAVSHTGKCFHWSVCVYRGMRDRSFVYELMHICVQGRCGFVCVCVQAGKALNICLSSIHPARLTSEVFLSPG